MLRIAIFLSTFGGSPLQGGIERGLMELGHEVCTYRPGNTYDLIIVMNQVAHRFDYRYPDFPTCKTPIAFVDCAEYGYFTRLPDRIGNFSTAFAPGSIHHDTKNKYEQGRLRQFLEGRSFPYFLREFSRYVEFTASYHPIDYPLYYLSKCDHIPNLDEYRWRQLELFCSWGSSHPWRLNITEALRECHTRCEIDVIGVSYQGGPLPPRIPQAHYFERMRAAKMTVSYDGYGSGAFRMMEALVRTLLLMAPLSIVTREPLVDGETCRMYKVVSEGEEFISTNVGDVLRSALADPVGSYEIFRRGHEHCLTHYTEKATAAYLLRTVEAHDWSKPTPLTV